MYGLKNSSIKLGQAPVFIDNTVAMYKNTQLLGNAHAYPDVGLCFLLISFVTFSSKMVLYAFYIYEC